MTITGTSYFVSEYRAALYYRSEYPTNSKGAMSLAKATVRRNLAEGAIHIGKPELKEGESLALVDNGTRYAIVSKEGK